jgi:hypothetical protein
MVCAIGRTGEVGEVAADVGKRRPIATDLRQRLAPGEIYVDLAQPARVEIDRERHGDHRPAMQIAALLDAPRLERLSPAGTGIAPVLYCLMRSLVHRCTRW